MSVQINPLSISQTVVGPAGAAPKNETKVPFADYLRGAFQQTDDLQREADRGARELLSGDLEDLHNLMISTEQAQLSLQLTVQVVNKVIQAYQEVYRMQI